MVTMIARPTTTSAAATIITKKAPTCPSREPCTWEKVTKAKFAALSINSTDIKATKALRLVRKPTMPIANKIAESTR